MADEITDGIPEIDIKDEISASFLEYAMSVIVSRALPTRGMA